MSDTLGRILRRPPPATSGGSNLFQAKRALASATGHMVVSDLNHMGEQYAHRRLAAHPGWFGFWAGQPSGVVDLAGPELGDIDWASPVYLSSGVFAGPGRTANACLGTHWVVPVGATQTYPRAVLRCRARAAVSASSATGIYFGASPGVGTFPTSTSPRDRVRITGSTFQDIELKILLDPVALAPWVTTPSLGRTASGTARVGDAVRLMAVTLWVGCYNSNNKNLAADDLTDVAGVTVGLEP